MDKSALIGFSGGIHSTTLAYEINDKYDLRALFFKVGQLSWPRELRCVKRTTTRLRIPLEVHEDHLSELYIHSVDAPYYLLTEMRSSARQSVSLCAYAELLGIDTVFQAYTKDDLRRFPQVPDALRLVGELFTVSTGRPFRIETPWIEMTNAEVTQKAIQLGVPLEDTWSCRWGYRIHCGVCVSCEARQAAFEEIGVKDPVQYMRKETAAAIAGNPYELEHPEDFLLRELEVGAEAPAISGGSE